MYLLNKKKEKILRVLPFSDARIMASFEQYNFYGVFFFRQAGGHAIIDQQQVELRDHTILFYYPYQQLALKGKVEGLLIQFHPDFFCIDIHAKDIGCQGVLFNNFYGDLLLTCAQKEFNALFQFHRDVQRELSSKRVGQLDMVSSLLKIFLIKAVRVKLGQQVQALSGKDNLHHQMERLIEKHFITHSSPKFYAEELGISLSTFNRLCQHYFQNSFITILHLKRISMAKNKLFLTNFAVKDIAYEVGFNDPLYFSRVFKRYCGLRPTEFREQLKSNRLI